MHGHTNVKQKKNAVQTIQNTVNTSTHVTKTPTHYKTINATLKTLTLIVGIKRRVEALVPRLLLR